jgi:hypothetical protein
MNKVYLFAATFITVLISQANATDFTISSYNCGGLTNHYDYLRAATMQKLTQERHDAEPEIMALNKRIQQVALKIMFGKDETEIKSAQIYWNKNEFDKAVENLYLAPTNSKSINYKWYTKSDAMISSYKVRPITINDTDVSKMVQDHIADIFKVSIVKKTNLDDLITETRAVMAERIFHNNLKYDIICLQEADYLKPSMFPHNYDVLFSDEDHSVNAIAWNKDRFELLQSIGSVANRAFVALFKDRTTEKTVLVASGHLTGSNPFIVETNKKTNVRDSDAGDNELYAMIATFADVEADIKILALDSNVTATHPRMHIFKSAGFHIDASQFLEHTCTNPYQVMNTRIDWIAIKSHNDTTATVTNIPVLGVGLNSIQTNISDHKPIAAKIHY